MTWTETVTQWLPLVSRKAPSWSTIWRAVGRFVGFSSRQLAITSATSCGHSSGTLQSHTIQHNHKSYVELCTLPQSCCAYKHKGQMTLGQAATALSWRCKACKQRHIDCLAQFTNANACRCCRRGKDFSLDRSELPSCWWLASAQLPEHHTIAVHVYFLSATRLAQKHLQNGCWVIINISLPWTFLILCQVHEV